MGGRIWALVSSRVAVAVRVGHAGGEGSGGLAVGAGGRVAPASVAAVVLGHGQSDGRQRWVVVGVEAILFHLLPALVLGRLALLAFPPEEQATEHEQCYDNDGNNHGNGCLAARAEPARIVALGILEFGGIGAGGAGRS